MEGKEGGWMEVLERDSKDHIQEMLQGMQEQWLEVCVCSTDSAA